MTPTPREDTMAEQTDQIIERMRTRAMVAGQCSVEAPDNVHSSMAAAEAEFLTECADLLAAQVRERDAAILRYQTAELEQNAVIARLSAHVEDAEQRYRVTYTSLCDQAAQAVTLRAERDAAQQQIATLTEALKELREDIESGAWAERNDASKWAERDLIWFISAALQSTRPQEQPAEPDYIDIEPDIRVVRVYRDGSWLEDLKAGGRRRASFPPATHQQGGHQP